MAVKRKFSELFSQEPFFVRSPGRINLIGEHTDYNDGFVMPAAIDKEIVFAFAPARDGNSTIYSIDFDETFHVDLGNPARIPGSHWANYLLGIVKSLQMNGHTVKPFVCVVGGNIPVGAGLSSSAALECGFAFGLDELNKLGLSKQDIILTAQWSEHNYAGVRCGIMDQFSSVMGKQGHVLMLDCRDLTFDYFPFHAPSYQLVLMDSRVKHSLASSEYNTRRQECEQGVRFLQQYHPAVKSLRDVTPEMLKEHASSLDEKVHSRCLYAYRPPAKT
jgi:galactokinase